MNEVDLRPLEIIEVFKECPYNEAELGYLLKMKLVKGYHKNRLTIINLPSLYKLIEFRNNLLISQIIQK